MHLFDNLDSGNGYKVRLLLAQLGRPYEWTNLDLDAGAARTPEFLKRNPNGRIPTLELDDGTHLAESNAILYYLAEGTPLLPIDRLGRAQVLQWMFFEQYSHEPYIAVARFLRRLHPDPASQRALADSRMDGGYRALDVMEKHLAHEPFFVGGHYTIADIALYAYTHVAPDGGFDLARFPSVRAWLARVEAQPGYVKMADA